MTNVLILIAWAFCFLSAIFFYVRAKKMQNKEAVDAYLMLIVSDFLLLIDALQEVTK